MMFVLKYICLKKHVTPSSMGHNELEDKAGNSGMETLLATI